MPHRYEARLPGPPRRSYFRHRRPHLRRRSAAPQPTPMPEGVIHAEVHDGILTADLAANLRLVKKACGSLSHPVARQIMVFEMPVGGARMTKAVLEARLVKRGFNPTEASTTVMALLGDRSLQVDFREPISAGSLIWRRRKDQKSNHDALPWDQVLAYCSPV